MPLVEITMKEGRPNDKKAALIKNVTDTVEQTLDAPRQSIRVILREVPGHHWGIAGVADDPKD